MVAGSGLSLGGWSQQGSEVIIADLSLVSKAGKLLPRRSPRCSPGGAVRAPSLAAIFDAVDNEPCEGQRSLLADVPGEMESIVLFDSSSFLLVLQTKSADSAVQYLLNRVLVYGR